MNKENLQTYLSRFQQRYIMKFISVLFLLFFDVISSKTNREIRFLEEICTCLLEKEQTLDKIGPHFLKEM